MGILFWASAKSPERLDPAIIPEITNTHVHELIIIMKSDMHNHSASVPLLTCDRWKEDTNQNCKCCRDIIHYLIIRLRMNVFKVFWVTSVGEELSILWRKKKKKRREINIKKEEKRGSLRSVACKYLIFPLSKLSKTQSVN